MSLIVRLMTGLAKHAWDARGIILVLLVMLAGLALVGLGAVYRTPPDGPPPWSEQWLGDLAWRLGTIVLGGGVVAFLLRLFLSMRLLEQALSNFLVSDDFLRLRNDLDDLWVRLTALVYMKTLKGDPAGQNLRSRVHNEIKNQLHYTHGFYIESSKREITLRWKDRANLILQLTEAHKFCVIPFDPAEPVTFETRFTARAGMSLNDYAVLRDDLTPQASLSSTAFKVTSKETETGDERIRSYTIQGATRYPLVRSRVLTWSIVNDRYFSFSSPYIVDGTEIIVGSSVNDIRTTFISFGMQHRFNDEMPQLLKESRPGDVHHRLSGILLPGRGYGVFFEPLAAPKGKEAHRDGEEIAG